MCTFSVAVPPSISPGETDITVLEGNPVILECEADGDPFPQIEWRKDGVIFDSSDTERGYYMGEAGTLAIEAARLTDAGKYTCTASNPAGKEARVIQLTVHGE